MNLINTSQDILYLVIAFCVLLFTLFVCALLYYSLLSIRNVFKITKRARDSVDKVHNILSVLKERMDSTLSYVYLLEEGIKKISETITEYKTEEKKTKNKKGQTKKKTPKKKDDKKDKNS